MHASVTDERTQPLVLSPPTMTVSTSSPFKSPTSGVPQNALGEVFFSTHSPSILVNDCQIGRVEGTSIGIVRAASGALARRAPGTFSRPVM